MRSAVSNEEVAGALERVGDLLAAQGAETFRVRAYHDGAATLRGLERPVAELARQGGRGALEALPTIGKSLASAIVELVETGRLGLLDRLEGQVSPEDLFTTVPGIGEELARRVHAVLGVETLEELELAAHDGRLEGVPGFGPRRVRSVREILGTMLSRSVRRRARRVASAAGADGTGSGGPEEERPEAHRPPVGLLLAVDREYRAKARAGDLPTIRPRRFNPERRAWLPVLHMEQDCWSFTALFSNTAQAHQLGRTRDWVVVYHERDGHEDQCTVVTERKGPMEGRRVVRGREGECFRHYVDEDRTDAGAATGNGRSAPAT